MSLSDDHKAAIAKGRSEARIVRAYLDAVATKTPRRGASVASLKQGVGRLAGTGRGGAELAPPPPTHPAAL